MSSDLELDPEADSEFENFDEGEEEQKDSKIAGWRCSLSLLILPIKAQGAIFKVVISTYWRD